MSVDSLFDFREGHASPEAFWGWCYFNPPYYLLPPAIVVLVKERDVGTGETVVYDGEVDVRVFVTVTN